MQPGIIILVLGLLTGAHVYSLPTTHIEGTIKGIPNYNNLDAAKAVLIKTSTNARVDSTHTNSNGWYQLNTVWTRIQEQLQEKESRLYPNPSQGVINIDFFSADKDNYTLIMNDQLGRQCFATQIPVEKGNSTITLKGGNEGAYFITLTDGKNTHNYTSMITTGTGSNISIAINTNDGSKLKSTLDEPLNIGDEVKIEFTKDGYLLSDTTFILGAAQIINKNLQQIPLTFTTTLKPYLETGEPVTNVAPNYTITFEFPPAPQGPGTKTYPVTNGQINIQEELFPLNGPGSVWVSHDTSTYNGNGVQAWTLIRLPHQKTNRPNVAQNESSILIPEFKTLVPLDSLNGRFLYLYNIRKKAETQPGQFESMSSPFSLGLIGESGASGAGNFVDISQYNPQTDSADFVRFGFNFSNNVQNTPAEQARLDQLFQYALNTRYLQNGDTAIAPHRVYTITSTADPRWQEVIARNFENMIYTTYYDGTPGNTREFSNLYTYNNEFRIKNTSAMYNKNDTDGEIFAENFSAVTGEEEIAGSLGQYVWNVTTNLPSQYAYSISAVPALLNLGTSGVDKKILGHVRTCIRH